MKAGDLVLQRNPKFITWYLKNKYGIVISLYGKNVIAWFTNKGIKIDKKAVGNIALTPKKPYSKYEQETISKAVMEDYINVVKMFGERGIVASIMATCNDIRPNTFDSPAALELNRYYRTI